MPEASLSVLYAEHTGAVDRIFSLLRRREFPIAGVTIERTHQLGIGRMTVMVESASAINQITQHLNRLVDVVSVGRESDDAIRREYALVRIKCTPGQRVEVLPILATFQAQALSVTANHMVLETSGTGDQIDTLVSALEPYGIDQLARTNPLVMGRQEAQPDSTFKGQGSK